MRLAPNFERVSRQPARIIGPVAIGKKVNLLIGRADPAPPRFRLLAQVGTVNEDVGMSQ